MKLGLRHAAVECTSLKAASDFYIGKLGMKSYYQGDGDWAMLSLGDSYLSLVLVRNVRRIERTGTHQAHLGFLFSSEAEVRALHQQLTQLGQPSLGGCKLHRDGSYGFYLSDPDGNSIECIFIPHRAHTVSLHKEAWVLLAHGSSDPAWGKPFELLAEEVKRHAPSVTCRLCFMGSSSPSLPQVLEALRAQGGIERVLVFPLFLSAGGVHMKHDVPELVENAKRDFPEFLFKSASTIGEHPLVQHAMVAAVLRMSEEI